MKLRTYTDEDSFHKREIVKDISTGLNQQPNQTAFMNRI